MTQLTETQLSCAATLLTQQHSCPWGEAVGAPQRGCGASSGYACTPLDRRGQVNGDVQRGKSTMEAFQALIVKRINDSERVRDKCFSVLGTQLLPWAEDLSNKIAGMTQRRRRRRNAARDPD